MKAESILTEFRKRRKLLDNVNALNVNHRIKAFIEYCKSVPEIEAIIQNHFDRYPTFSLLKGTGDNKPPKAGTLEEIVSVGLYLMYECSEGNELNSLAVKHGISRVGQSGTAENYVYAAMHQYIGHTLDYLEDRIKQAVETPDEPDDEGPNKGRAYGEGKYGEGPYGGKSKETKDVQAIIEEAIKAFGDSNLDRAIELCEKALSINPNHMKAMELRGALYNRLGKYDEAIEQFENILQKDPKNINALQGKGSALFGKKDYEAAYDMFEILTKLEPGNIIAWHTMGESLFYRERFDEAIKCFDKAIKINPHNDRSWVMKAQALLKKGENESAINCFNEALEHATNKSYVLLEEGIAYGRMGKKNEELYFYDQAIENNPKYIQAYMQKAHVLSQDEDYEGAIECFRKGIDNDLKPEREAILWHNLASTYLSINRLEEAYESINHSLELHDNDLARKFKDGIEMEMSSKGAGGKLEGGGQFESDITVLEKHTGVEFGTTPKQIIHFASELAFRSNPEKPTLTTSEIVFALANFGKKRGKIYNTARFFLKSLRRTGSKTLESYFKRSNEQAKAVMGKPKTEKYWVTNYVIGTVKLAQRFAIETTGSDILHVRHLLAGLILFSPEGEKSGAQKRLVELGVDIKSFVDEYFGYLEKTFRRDSVEAWGQILENVIKKPTGEEKPRFEPEALSTARYAVGDIETEDDKLGFGPYVEAVAEFLVHEDTQPPLTMSVEGEWGSGKSSFMWQLKNELRRCTEKNTVGLKEKNAVGSEDEIKKTSRWSLKNLFGIYDKVSKYLSWNSIRDMEPLLIDFKPWRHDKDEALWAAFALEFIRQASARLGFWNRVWTNWKLRYSRFDIKEGWADLAKVVIISIAWILATAVIVIGLWRGATVGEDGSLELPVKLGALTVMLGSIWLTFGKVKDFLGSPLDVDLRKYMKKPDYVSHVSFIEHFHKDFKDVVRSYAGQQRVYVFIDDLDRCRVPKAAELMESINLMISDNPKLVFIMGMDREKVAAGLAVKHEKLLDYLSSQVEVESGSEKRDKRMRGIRYGYSFIEKFIQIPFILPIPSSDDINNMLLEMAGEKEEDVVSIEPEKERPTEPVKKIEDKPVEEPELKPAVPSKEKKEAERDERKEARKEVMLKFEGDDENFRSVVLMVSEAFGNNPRRAKQFVNLFRLRIRTAASTGLITPEERQLTFVQLGKFVGIGLGWPLFIRVLERDYRLLDELVDVAEGEKKPEEIDKKIKEWATDEKLIDLIKSGCFDEKEKKKKEGEYKRYSMRGLNVERLMKVAPRIKQMVELEKRTDDRRAN